MHVWVGWAPPLNTGFDDFINLQNTTIFMRRARHWSIDQLIIKLLTPCCKAQGNGEVGWKANSPHYQTPINRPKSTCGLTFFCCCIFQNFYGFFYYTKFHSMCLYFLPMCEIKQKVRTPLIKSMIFYFWDKFRITLGQLTDKKFVRHFIETLRTTVRQIENEVWKTSRQILEILEIHMETILG